VTWVDKRWPNQVLNCGWHRLGWPAVDSLAGVPLDVVQAFHPLLIPSRRAARLVTIHDLNFLDQTEFTEREIRRDYPALAPVHARRADHIIVNSQTTANDVQSRFGIDPSRMTVCTPGAPRWAPRRDEPQPGCILFLGTLEPRKNLGVLLDAYERLLTTQAAPPPLVLAGGATDLAADIIARTARPPLAGHVELPGYIEPGVREALYRRATILVMPSHTEGFGIPVLEAMTVGVPVVVANRGALPEVSGKAGVRFEPDDAAELASCLAGLLDSRERRQALREAGWTQAQRFSWRQSAAQLRHAWSMAQNALRGPNA
jgi:glycosyltransferase involved in cell wall biosynthesis